MKTKILILVMALFCLGTVQTFATDYTNDIDEWGQNGPCALSGGVATTWNPVQGRYFEYNNEGYLAEYYESMPDYAIYIATIYKLGDNPTNADVSELYKALMLDIIREKGLSGVAPLTVRAFDLASCVEKFYINPAPPFDYGREYLDLPKTAFRLLSTATQAGLAPYLTELEDIFKIPVVNFWKGCSGNICCRAIYNIQYDINQRYPMRVELSSVITGNTKCPFSVIAVGSCGPNCNNFFSSWTRPVEDFNSYPNPSDGNIKFYLGLDYIGNFNVVVKDAGNNTVYSGTVTLNLGRGSLDLSALPSGTYYISIYSGVSLLFTDIIIIQ